MKQPSEMTNEELIVFVANRYAGGGTPAADTLREFSSRLEAALKENREMREFIEFVGNDLDYDKARDLLARLEKLPRPNSQTLLKNADDVSKGNDD